MYHPHNISHAFFADIKSLEHRNQNHVTNDGYNESKAQPSSDMSDVEVGTPVTDIIPMAPTNSSDEPRGKTSTISSIHLSDTKNNTRVVYQSWQASTQSILDTMSVGI